MKILHFAAVAGLMLSAPAMADTRPSASVPVVAKSVHRSSSKLRGEQNMIFGLPALLAGLLGAAVITTIVVVADQSNG